MTISAAAPDIGALLKRIGARHGMTLRLLRRAAAGESGAYFVSDDSGRQLIFKFGYSDEFHPQVASDVTSRLRAAGYPAPRYIAVGSDGDDALTYALQETMPGSPRGRLRAAHAARLIELNRLQARRAGSLAGDWPSRPVTGVMTGFAEYCVIDSMRRHSADTAAMLARLQSVVERYAGDCARKDDIVHWDFNPGNILTDGTSITGVVDWDGVCAGDRGFDLATLIFYEYENSEVRAPLMREALDCSGARALTVYFSHMIARQVEWSTRNHDGATVVRYMATANAILGEMEIQRGD